MAERAGLRPGDTILEVNGTPFRAVTHEEALKVSLQLLFFHHHPFQSTSWIIYLSPTHPTPSLLYMARYLLILAVSLTSAAFEAFVNSKRHEREDNEIRDNEIVMYCYLS